MTCHLAAQLAAAAARNREALGERCRTYPFRIELADGTQINERHIGLSQVAALYPAAKRIERLSDGDKAAFW